MLRAYRHFTYRSGVQIPSDGLFRLCLITCSVTPITSALCQARTQDTQGYVLTGMRGPILLVGLSRDVLDRWARARARADTRTRDDVCKKLLPPLPEAPSGLVPFLPLPASSLARYASSTCTTRDAAYTGG